MQRRQQKRRHFWPLRSGKLTHAVFVQVNITMYVSKGSSQI
jgi:hypothetical protein